MRTQRPTPRHPIPPERSPRSRPAFSTRTTMLRVGLAGTVSVVSGTHKDWTRIALVAFRVQLPTTVADDLKKMVEAAGVGASAPQHSLRIATRSNCVNECWVASVGGSTSLTILRTILSAVEGPPAPPKEVAAPVRRGSVDCQSALPATPSCEEDGGGGGSCTRVFGPSA